MEIAAIVVAALSITGAFVKLFTILTERQKRIQEEVREVHILVNDRMSKAINRIDQLIEALETANVDVPEKPAEN